MTLLAGLSLARDGKSWGNLTTMQSRSLLKAGIGPQPKGSVSLRIENMKEHFVSEQLIPIPAELDITYAALGEPAMVGLQRIREKWFLK